MSSTLVRNQIMLACTNLEQVIEFFEFTYMKLTKLEQEQLRSRFEENEYAIQMIKQMDSNIKDGKRKKIMEKEKAKEENSNGENQNY